MNGMENSIPVQIPFRWPPSLSHLTSHKAIPFKMSDLCLIDTVFKYIFIVCTFAFFGTKYITNILKHFLFIQSQV